MSGDPAAAPPAGAPVGATPSTGDPAGARPPVARSTRRLVAFALVALALGLLGCVLVVYFQRGFVPGDAIVYLAAGERLNAGHPLYALSPGDRPVELKPPYWTSPLLSPPLIAVVFRPLALLPPDLGAYVWWALTIAAIAATLVMLLRRSPIATSLAILALTIPIAYEIGVGNVNGLILLGSVVAWVLARDRREVPLGTLVAVMSALKVTPLALGVWVLARGRRDSIVAFIVAGAATVVVSVLGAGLQAHIDYLGIARQTNVGGASDLSLAGYARALGVDAAAAMLLPWAALVVGLVATVALRRRPALSYCAAVLTMVFGSPVVNINTLALLLALLAPVAFPSRPGLPAGGVLAAADPEPGDGTPAPAS